MLTKLLRQAKELEEIRKQIDRDLTPEERTKWLEYKKIKEIFVKMPKDSRQATLQCLKDVHEFLIIKDTINEFWEHNEEEF